MGHARRGWRSALMLLAVVAGAVGAPASSPSLPQWSADPEQQYLLDLTVRQYRLGDGVRAYPTPEGTCVLLGDFLTALDVPMKIDLTAGKASGWAFGEQNRISIDRTAGTATFSGQREAFTPASVRDTPDGWCVDVAALGRWFGVKLSANLNASVLELQSEAKLPAEQAAERRERAGRLHKASFDLATLPQVKLPYRLWRTPAVDVVVDAGVTYDARSGARVDRRAAMLFAGEVARMSYFARIGTDEKGRPESLRFKAFRSDPDGGLLGPLGATHAALGDVEGVASSITGSSAAGRGAVLTNRPVLQPLGFDRTSFTGDLPSGWDAEIYRNGELLGFAAGGSDQRYRFDEVPLLFGENRFEIITYGPQGQVRSRVETLNVADQSVPAGRTWYWAGVVDPGRDLLDFRDRANVPDSQQGLQAAAQVEHGISQRLSVGGLVQTLVQDDQRVTFVEGSVRRSIGPALVEIAAARDTAGGMAARGQLLARVGGVSIAARSLLSSDFAARPGGLGITGEHRLSLDAPLNLKNRTLPLHADVRLTQFRGGNSRLEAEGRTALMVSRFNLATSLRYRKSFGSGPAPPDEVEVGLIGSGRLGRVRLRGATDWRIAPDSRLERAELSAYWNAGENTDWEGGLAYEAPAGRVRGRVSHIRRLGSMAVALTGEAASDGSVAAGVNLAFSLDRAGDRWRMSRQPLASSGSVRASVFRDVNGNGIRDAGEPGEAGALVTAGLRMSDEPTGKDGRAAVGGLENFRAVAVGVDASSLSDPRLTPTKTAQVVVPRPGVAAEVEIGLVGGSDIEGVLLKDGGGPFEGLDLELVDAGGRVVAVTRSDYDGYFSFERVAPGRYAVRLTQASAAVAGAAPVLAAQVDVVPDRPVIRLGSLVVARSTQRIANQEVGLDDLGAGTREGGTTGLR